jgi:4-diphosphocytidyl-2-C-methyl-D-erythritol kinase
MELSSRRLVSPAKINLGLRILGRRPDGFHTIQTLLQMLDLGDWLAFSPNDTGAIVLTCNLPHLPTDERNLVVRAAQLLKRTMRVPLGAEIHLTKSTPIAAGLGGGSSNAALTLLALNRLWRLDCPVSSLHPLAAALGSDVPFFLNGPTALAEGRGELLSPLPPPAPVHGLLINPGFGVSAGWAYSQFDGRSGATAVPPSAVLRALERQEWATLTEALVNDLEPGVAAVHPVVRDMQEALRAVGAQVTFMSGSGPTVGGFFTSAAMLAPAMQALRQQSAWTSLPFATLSESPYAELQG